MKNKVIQTTQNHEWEASEDAKNVEFIIENVRFAFTKNGKNFFEPEEFKKTRKFKGQFILEDEDTLEQVKEVVQFLVVNNIDEDFEFDKNFAEQLKQFENLFLRDGNDHTNKDGETYDGFTDKFFVTASRNETMKAPVVFDNTGEEIKEYDENKLFKDGCYGNVALRAYYSKEWGMIGCTLEAIIYTKEGESFVADSSFASSEAKKKKLFGSFKPKNTKSKMVFGKKKTDDI